MIGEAKWTRQIDQLTVFTYASNDALGMAAAQDASVILKEALAERGTANLILATGNSQLTFLRALCQIDGIDWAHVQVFHLDEYIGIDPAHPASFPMFLHHHFLKYVKPGTFHPVPAGASDLDMACGEYERLLRMYPADLVVTGIGENGHLAFNEPPARFHETAWVKVVELADISRRQQIGEGHFPTLDDVPSRAMTLTIPALLAAKHICCIAPEARKAEIVRACLEEPISEMRPASILRRAPHARLYLDLDSAAHLTPRE